MFPSTQTYVVAPSNSATRNEFSTIDAWNLFFAILDAKLVVLRER